jgi:hypothetical protein
MVKNYLKTGVGLIGSSIFVGSIPNISGTSTETTLKTNYATGLSNVGSKLPIYGKLVGTKLVLKSVKNLSKKTKNIF